MAPKSRENAETSLGETLDAETFDIWVSIEAIWCVLEDIKHQLDGTRLNRGPKVVDPSESSPEL